MPPPEPSEVTELTPSPDGGETLVSGTPPGPSSVLLGGTPGPPVRWIASSCKPVAGVRCTTSLRPWSALPSPVVSKLRIGPPDVSDSWNVSPDTPPTKYVLPSTSRDVEPFAVILKGRSVSAVSVWLVLAGVGLGGVNVSEWVVLATLVVDSASTGEANVAVTPPVRASVAGAGPGPRRTGWARGVLVADTRKDGRVGAPPGAPPVGSRPAEPIPRQSPPTRWMDS